MNKVKRFNILYLFVLVMYGFLDKAVAIPTNATTLSTTEQPASPSESPMDRLNRLCNFSVNMGRLDASNDAIVKVIADGMEKFFREHPDEEIRRCIIEVPEQKFNLDKRINGYNDSKSWHERFGTAFLLVGKAYGVNIRENEASCTIGSTFIAGEDKGVSSHIPKTWTNYFFVTDAITLDSGQKLIGIPIDVNKVALAEDYHISMARRISASFSCHWHSTDATFNQNTKRDNLIRLAGSGVVISGITNATSFSYRQSYSKLCYQYGHFGSRRLHRRTIYPDMVYSDMIKIDLQPMSFNYPEGYSLIKITNSNLFQINDAIVNMSLEENHQDIFSRWLDDRVFISFRNNTFSSCYASKNRVPKKDIDTPLKINLQYTDYSNNTRKTHVLDFQDNKFITDVREVLDLKVAPNSATLIKDNSLTSLGFSAGRTAGIIISGITKPELASLTSPGFQFENNDISGFMTSIALLGQLDLHLKSNKLLGKQQPFGRTDFQIYPIKLSGDNNNSYLKEIESPCEALEETSIEGGFIFSDGTPCPSGYISPSASTFTTTPMTSLAATSLIRSASRLQSITPGIQTTPVVTTSKVKLSSETNIAPAVSQTMENRITTTTSTPGSASTTSSNSMLVNSSPTPLTPSPSMPVMSTPSASGSAPTVSSNSMLVNSSPTPLTPSPSMPIMSTPSASGSALTVSSNSMLVNSSPTPLTPSPSMPVMSTPSASGSALTVSSNSMLVNSSPTPLPPSPSMPVMSTPSASGSAPTVSSNSMLVNSSPVPPTPSTPSITPSLDATWKNSSELVKKKTGTPTPP
ncbi:hypothetical protein NX722_01550 [Endozoicomonas gorgoniicola]|uniref:Uncharacterized protein n=1 Tax=Endozoicomonas gorgoniicola TaxID=1234144 RepID=A0ABT3MPP1_9GAMM|nr:hypothetical protein [Endozoicomonas gorgoniicola]MCW7551346.1 hypothetical protein [Endozoicomonas gorgoniicola]